METFKKVTTKRREAPGVGGVSPPIKVKFAQYTYWKWGKNIKMGKSNRYNIEVDKNKKEDILPIIKNSSKNKREICQARMAERELIVQARQNPFLFKRNYVNDLQNQDKFLRPLDSNSK